jgi:uncharacterized membrane protein YtjA (UPF0391 family)
MWSPPLHAPVLSANSRAFRLVPQGTSLSAGKVLNSWCFSLLRKDYPERRRELILAASRFHGERSSDQTRQRGLAMMGWAVTFLVVALIAAVLGFGGVAGVAVEAAKIVFFVAIILFAISAIAGLMRGRSPTIP